MVEAEGRARETKLAEEVNRQMLFDRAKAERKKWVAAINTTSEHIGVISTKCIEHQTGQLALANDDRGLAWAKKSKFDLHALKAILHSL
ncbi:hypothetical protein K1719_018378 [Acacia pycnantha]|nr:hypothetical protein K1719_018378 [Acacia pycnantha]